MIKNADIMVRFERNRQRHDRRSFEEKLLTFKRLVAFAQRRGVLPPVDRLEGIEE